jgi:hypothetical protein
MAADAWHEFRGWDGRFVRTFRRLLGTYVWAVLT